MTKTGSNIGESSETERKDSRIELPVEKMTEEENSNGHVVDIEKWASSMERMLEEVPHYMCTPGHPGRISRLPENLREVDKKAYEPYFLSIGPYHHGKPRVQRMEKRKRIVLKCFLEQNPELTLKDYLKEMKNIEPAARSFYTDVKMDSEQFLQMLLLDGVYIIAMFYGIAESQKRPNHTNTSTGITLDNEGVNETINTLIEGMESHDDNENTEMVAKVDEINSETRSVQNKKEMPRWFLTLCVHDFFLLENQLPFFVLQKIHDLAYSRLETKLLDRMKEVIGTMLARYRKIDSDMVILPTEKVHHILHLCHMFFRPAIQQEPTAFQHLESSQTFRLGSAMQLYESGVSFETRSRSTQYSLLDITFGKTGIMTMPCLPVDDNTNSLLRNLIALEQMKYPSLGLDVAAYAVLLLHLVTIPEDVGLLRRKGIIQHHLASDKEVVFLINRLSVGLSFDYMEDNYSLKPLFLELRRYTELRVPRWKAGLKHRHFRNPWTVISLLVASLLLLSTVVGTYYTVYSYYYPNIHS